MATPKKVKKKPTPKPKLVRKGESTKPKKKESVFSKIAKSFSRAHTITGAGNPYRDKKTGKFTSKK